MRTGIRPGDLTVLVLASIMAVARDRRPRAFGGGRLKANTRDGRDTINGRSSAASQQELASITT